MKLIFATKNSGKTRELSKALEKTEFSVESLINQKIEAAPETGSSFLENALIKCKSVSEITGRPTIADDSGLVVPALNGRPGIYSARWAGDDKDFSTAMAKVNAALCELDKKLTIRVSRSASFFCALALAWPDNKTEIFEGSINGTLCWPPRGENGFGYDPIFIPTGYDETFGEFDQKLKHSISHRAKAFTKFLSYVQNEHDGQ